MTNEVQPWPTNEGEGHEDFSPIFVTPDSVMLQIATPKGIQTVGFVDMAAAFNFIQDSLQLPIDYNG